MNFGLKRAVGEWTLEVEREAERLIRNGAPPYEAVERARQIVSARRRAQEEQR